MSGTKSIELAIELATVQRDAQLKNLTAAQAGFGSAQGQLEQLTTYAQDTDGRWTAGQTGGMSVELIHHHYQFMARLQSAIEMQTGVIARMGHSLEQARLAVVQAEVRLGGLQRLLAQRQAHALALQRRREQRQTDEFAAQQYTRRQAATQLGETP